MKTVVIAGTQSGRAFESSALGVITLLRYKGYIVQAFVVGRAASQHSSLLQSVTNRRVLFLDPWLHAGAALNCVFWSGCEGADAAVVLVWEGLVHAHTMSTPSWQSCRDLLSHLSAPALLVASEHDSPEDITTSFYALPEESTSDTYLIVCSDAAGQGSTAAVQALPQAWEGTATSRCTVSGCLPTATLLSTVQTMQPEYAQADLERLHAFFSRHVSIGPIISAMASAQPSASLSQHSNTEGEGMVTVGGLRRHSGRVAIAVAVDVGQPSSQHQGNLAVLERLGCELISVSLVTSTALPPDITALYISGCLSPSDAVNLSANTAMRMSVSAFAACGGIIYAESAGLAYLATSVRMGEEVYNMSAVLPMHVTLHDMPIASGYVELDVTEASKLFARGSHMRGFVDSALEVRQEVSAKSLARNGLGRRWASDDPELAHSFEARLVEVEQCGAATRSLRSCTSLNGEVGASEAAVAEGYSLRCTVATVVHVAFASCVPAVSELVASCRRVDAQAVSVAAQQRIVQRVRRCSLQPGGVVGSVCAGDSMAAAAAAAKHVSVASMTCSPTSPRSPASAAAEQQSYSAIQQRQRSASCDTSLWQAQSRGPFAPVPIEPTDCTRTRSAPFSSSLVHYSSPLLINASLSHTLHSCVPEHSAVSSPRCGAFSHPSGAFMHPSRSSNASLSSQCTRLRESRPSFAANALQREMRRRSCVWPPRVHGYVRVISTQDMDGLDLLSTSSDTHEQAQSHQRRLSEPSPQKGDQKNVVTSQRPLQINTKPPAPSPLSAPPTPSPGLRTTLPARPLVSLAPALTDILFEVGAGTHIAGTTASCRTRCTSAFTAPRLVVASYLNPPVPPIIKGLSHTALRPDSPTKPGPFCWVRKLVGRCRYAAPRPLWRCVANRVAERATDWQALHNVNIAALQALPSPLVLAWEPEAEGRGPVLAAHEPCHIANIDQIGSADLDADLITIRTPRTLAQCCDTITSVSKVVGCESGGDALLVRMRTEMQRVIAQCKAVPPPLLRRKRVLALRGVAPYRIAGGWVPELLELVGANVLDVYAGEGMKEITWDRIKWLRPDVILLLPEVVGVEDSMVEIGQLAEEPGWWSCPAVAKSELYVVDGTEMMRAGPGMVPALEAAARIVRPDIPWDERDTGASIRGYKLQLKPGQRCRPSFLPNCFEPIVL